MVRRATSRDVAGMVRVANQAFLEQARWSDRIGAGVVEHMRKHPDWQFVAEADGEVVGFLVGRPGGEAAHIMWIAVRPDHWGRGIGGRLLAAIEERAREAGLSAVELGTPFARPFYEKYGYKCVRTHRRMVLDLAQRKVERPRGLALRPIGLDDLPGLLGSLFGDEGECLDFLSKFFEAMGEDPDKALLGLRGEAPAGVVVGRAAERNWELTVVSYLFAVGREEALDLLRGLAHLCSCQGRRWLGVELPLSHLSEGDLSALGFEDAKLPTFWTSYRMRKEL